MRRRAARVNPALTPRPYTGAMTTPAVRLTLALAGCLAALPASAVTVTKVEIQGLADEAMRDNVLSALTLHDETGDDLGARRLNYLLRIAADEAREALEPFGYYAPTISVHRSDRDRPVAVVGDDEDPPTTDDDAPVARNGGNGKIVVTVRIDPGQPVRVRDFRVDMAGPARDDVRVGEALAAFAPRPGQVLDHAAYDASRDRVSRALSAHGYFDAAFDARRVEVTRTEHAADIDLRWSSGARHALGPARFAQEPAAIIDERLLQRLVNWEPGEPYDEARLERLRRSLVGLDYFGLVDVQPAPDAADGLQVPVQVALTPAARSVYTAGASYGTESGPGVRLGVERRYLNTRGHKALAQLDYAQLRKTLTLQYRVPAFKWLDGWYTASLQAADEQTEYVNSRRLEFVASRSGHYNDYLTLVASAHVLRERWQYALVDDEIGFQYTEPRFANFLFPSLRAEYMDADDRMFPRDALGGTLTLRGGVGGDEERSPFVQLHASVSWFKGLGEEDRLIVRGEAGHTYSDALLTMPPSLRYFAGGDRSIRGYGWREVGPRILVDGRRYATGARNVLTASAEYERWLRGPWGAAVFVDTGSAFNGRTPDLHTGVGIGLRWRSPVGLVRLDVARGLKNPASPFTLHLNIGADL